MMALHQQLAFFHGRAMKTGIFRNLLFRPVHYYRVYILPNELLFLRAGYVTPYAGGCGGLVQGVLAGRMEKSTAARLKEFDEAQPEELVQFLSADRRSFRASAADLLTIQIEPRSTWHSVMFANPDHVGILRLRHRERGNLVSEFLSLDEMHLALAKLPAVLGGKLAVKVVWDEKKQQYVRQS